MGNIKLLDCTLRDGGYINDWRFGEAAIQDMIQKLSNTGVDILEIGFLKNEPYQRDRTVFNTVHQISELIHPKRYEMEYAAMIEVVNPLPLEQLDPMSGDTVDIIRVIVWKQLMKEGFDYCKGVIERGYKLCVQPARVDQYSQEEFVEMIELFNQLDPMAVYVVDSWGTMYEPALMAYFNLADEYLKPGIALGYHGHNNLMQAYSVAQTFVNSNIRRDKIIDASVYGIGRGAGNLNLELFAKYLNEQFGRDFKTVPMIEVYESYVKQIYQQYPWGYSMPFFMTASYRANPNYGSYYGIELGMPATAIGDILAMLSDEDRVIYSQEKADRYLEASRKN